MGDASSHGLIAITGSKRPYLYDLPHVLSLPNEFEYRFRYRRTWVAPEVLAAASRGALRGQRLTICFHSLETKRLLPLRTGEILDVELLGPVVYVRFRVGAFCNVPLREYDPFESTAKDSEAAQAATKHALAMLDQAEDTKIDLGGALKPGWYLRFASVPPPSSTETGHAGWGIAAQLLANEPSLRGTPIFFILGFTRAADDEPITSSKLEQPLLAPTSDVRGFPLEQDHRYRLRVLQLCAKDERDPSPTFRVHCESPGECLSHEGASDLVVGRYDVLEYSFLAKAPGYSELAVTAERIGDRPASHWIERDEVSGDHLPAQPAGGVPEHRAVEPLSPPWPAVFSARIPVSVRRRRGIFALRAAVVGGGILLSALLYLYGATWWQGEYATPLRWIAVLVLSAAVGDPGARLVKVASEFKRLEAGK